MVHPEARFPLRFYRSSDELASFDLQRVQDYLSSGRWLRKTSINGVFSFNGQPFILGRAHKESYVLITYHSMLGFEVSCPPDETIIMTIDVGGLSVSDITGISV